jgi:bifunctional non-homologous end joining protein LigD
MRSYAFDPCIPTRGTKVPNRPEWLHEIKHDGYRLIIRRGKRVRLFTRNGYDWSHRFPLIAESALRSRRSSFVIDGEAVLLGVDGRSDFNGLHSRQHDEEVLFYAFDMLVSDGDDIRNLPLTMRKSSQPGSSRGEWMASSSAISTGRDRPRVQACLPNGARGARV